MGKSKLIYKDRAGNKLYVKYIKTRNSYQYIGKNPEGKVVDTAGAKYLMRKAKIGKLIKPARFWKHKAGRKKKKKRRKK